MIFTNVQIALAMVSVIQIAANAPATMDGAVVTVLILSLLNVPTIALVMEFANLVKGETNIANALLIGSTKHAAPQSVIKIAMDTVVASTMSVSVTRTGWDRIASKASAPSIAVETDGATKS